MGVLSVPCTRSFLIEKPFPIAELDAHPGTPTAKFSFAVGHIAARAGAAAPRPARVGHELR